MSSQVEIKAVEILMPDGRVMRAEFWLWETDPENPENVRLLLKVADKEIVRSDENYWTAMVSIRRELEMQGLLLRCYGSSRNVHPSGMILDMGTAEKAYRLKLGEHAKLAELVCIFDSGPDVEPVAVAEQTAFYTQWCHFRRP